MDGIVYIATSADGFIAGENDSLDFLGSAGPTDKEGEDYGFASFVASCDVVVMGRNTFDVAKTCVADGNADNWVYKGTTLYVLSNSMKELPAPFTNPDFPHKVVLYSGDISKLVDTIVASHKPKQEGQRLRVYADGGNVITQFRNLGLIKEYIITAMPVLIGSGVKLFASEGVKSEMTKLELVSCNSSYGNGVIQTSYRVKEERAE